MPRTPSEIQLGATPLDSRVAWPESERVFLVSRNFRQVCTGISKIGRHFRENLNDLSRVNRANVNFRYPSGGLRRGVSWSRLKTNRLPTSDTSQLSPRQIDR